MGTLLALEGAAHAADWTQMGLDGGRGRASSEISGAPFRAAWQAKVSAGPIVASPAVADGYVVVAGAGGELRALRATDGALAWSTTAAGPLGASPAISRGRLFVPTLNGRVQALRLADGRELWTRAFGGQNYGSPAVTGGSLVLAAGFPSQSVARLDAMTGATEWETAPGAIADLVTSSPAVTGGQVVFGMNGGRYQSFDAGTGATRWHVDTAGAVGLSAPLVVGDIAYFVPGGKSASMFASERATGATLPGWPVQVRDPAAPPASAFTSTRVAVSSPALLGTLIVFQARFEYDLRAATTGAAAPHTLREYVIAVDPATAAVSWQRAVAERQVESLNDVPELGLAATPAAFTSAAGPLVAVASSLLPAVRVLDAAGADMWSGAISAPTRSSPVLANGLLLVATDAGVVHAFQSSVNQAPLAPAADFVPAEGELVESTSPTLRWGPGQDPEADALAYQVRVDADGEVLETWLTEVETTGGAVEAAIPHGVLVAGASYTYAVRGRDPQGAWSAWSAPQSFIVAITPTVEIAGTRYDSLDQAIAAAASGSTIVLGRGLLHRGAPVQLPAGVSLAGAGPHDTIIDATGGAAGIEVTASGRSGASVISGLTVSGADAGIRVVDARAVTVRNVVVRDHKRAGIEVESAGSAEVVNVTVVRNATGIVARGKLSVRNSIVTENRIGFLRAGDGTLTSRYNDVVGNASVGYEGADAGMGDIAVAVRFQAPTRQDFHLTVTQATTDRGDPADEFASEPAPNGGRVNMGAFGNTATAEISATASGATADEPSSDGASGCSLGGRSRPQAAFLLLAAAALVLARRRGRGQS